MNHVVPLLTPVLIIVVVIISLSRGYSWLRSLITGRLVSISLGIVIAIFTFTPPWLFGILCAAPLIFYGLWRLHCRRRPYCISNPKHGWLRRRRIRVAKSALRAAIARYPSGTVFRCTDKNGTRVKIDLDGPDHIRDAFLIMTGRLVADQLPPSRAAS